MRTFLILVALAFMGLSVSAQDVSAQCDSVMTDTLPEMIVTARGQIETADKAILVPTAALRKHAANALDLTELMNVAGLVVSPQDKSVTTHSGGEVVLCINGVAARVEDVAMLQAQDVASVEYLRAPSGKWTGKAAVLNYVVRNSGGNVYLSADEGFIFQRGEYVAAVDYTRSKTKLRLAAMSNWNRDHSYVEESGLYTFADGHQLTRYYSPDHALARHHSEDVRFELTNKGDAHRFNLALGLDAATVPAQDMTTAVIYPADTTTMHRHTNSKALSPNISLEYTKWLPASQTIQFAASGSYGHNTYNSLYEETGQSAVTSHVKEDNFALAGQGRYFKTYSNQLMFMLMAGHALTNYKDHYSGTSTGYQHLVTNVTSAMLQLSRSSGSLSWYATAGVSNSAVTLGGKHYNYCSPIAYYGGTYVPRQDLSLSLNGVLTHTLFDPSNKNSMTLPVSFFEATQGNPDIEPLQVLSNTLSLSKQWGKHSLAVSYMSYIYFNNIVHQYYADPSVIYDKKLNDGNFYGNMLSVSWSFSALDDRLRVGLTGIGEYNAVRGDVYDLSRTIVRGRASVTWLQGDFKFSANFKTPSTQLDIREPFLVHDAMKLDFLAGWNHNGWSVELRLNNPFCRYYKSHEWMDYGCYDMDRWRMNESAGRNVSLKVTYALNFGKKTDRSDVQINPVINSAIMKSL